MDPPATSGRLAPSAIGLPGETVQLLGGQVTINGRLLVEPYLDSRTATYPDRYRPRETFRLGQGDYFVLGDNRRASLDSRVYGPVGRSSISGLVIKPYLQARARFENLETCVGRKIVTGSDDVPGARDGWSVRFHAECSLGPDETRCHA